jgi:PucR family transcriptional regulator, purine catabolism regulatory protein
VAITVKDLVGMSHLKLRLAAGLGGVDGTIRWVHTSELSDPTPWLSGGELLLTTGMGIGRTAADHRDYVGRLVKAKLAGLGFGMGFGHEATPAALAAAADDAGFPVVEVPYPTPFIAISEAVSTHLAQERLREAQASIEIHERLAAIVSEGAGPADVLDEVVELAGGWVLLFDARGDVVASSGDRGIAAPDPAIVWRGLPKGLTERRGPLTSSEVGPHGTIVALAVTAARRHEGVLVFGKGQRLDARDRFVVRHATTVLGLLLASRRAVLDAERRVAGDVVSEAFSGRLTGDDLARRLELVGFAPGARMTALVAEAGAGSQTDLDEAAWVFDDALGSRTGAARACVMAGRICALVSHPDPEALAEAGLREIEGAARNLRLDPARLRAGVGETVAAQDIRHSYLGAVMALRAAPAARRVASPRDLGSYGLLLGAQPRPVLENFVRSVLGPLIDRDRLKSSDLVASVRAFIEAGGRWEPGAEALGVHRHTLRYRVRQAEELLARDLSSAEDRLELWLALKAVDLLEE